jgi:glycosyltransferase involved in cell wall biosynthesis
MAENTSVLRKGMVVFAGKLLRVPVLLHLHAGLFIDFYRALPLPARLFTRRVFRAADHVIVLGEIWKRMLSDELGIDPARIAVVYNGVPPMPVRPRRAPNGVCRILYVGKLRSEKGLVELLEALSSARLKDAAWTLTLVGSGDRSRFESLAKARGLADRVSFTGWLEAEAVKRALGAADVFVLPSHYEGLPFGILEALSAGLAIVTTRVGALPEILRDGESALLVPRADTAALEEALFRVVMDEGLRTRLSAGALALYEAQFTIAHFTAAIEAQYALTMRARPARVPA